MLAHERHFHLCVWLTNWYWLPWEARIFFFNLCMTNIVFVLLLQKLMVYKYLVSLSIQPLEWFPFKKITGTILLVCGVRLVIMTCSISVYQMQYWRQKLSESTIFAYSHLAFVRPPEKQIFICVCKHQSVSFTMIKHQKIFNFHFYCILGQCRLLQRRCVHFKK